MAAKQTVVQVRRFLELGKLDPEMIVTPGIFVDRTVLVADPADEQALIAADFRREPQ